MTPGSVSRTILVDTLPSGPVQLTISDEAHLDRCDRVRDDRVVGGGRFFGRATDHTPPDSDKIRVISDSVNFRSV